MIHVQPLDRVEHLRSLILSAPHGVLQNCLQNQQCECILLVCPTALHSLSAQWPHSQRHRQFFHGQSTRVRCVRPTVRTQTECVGPDLPWWRPIRLKKSSAALPRTRTPPAPSPSSSLCCGREQWIWRAWLGSCYLDGSCGICLCVRTPRRTGARTHTPRTRSFSPTHHPNSLLTTWVATWVLLHCFEEPRSDPRASTHSAIQHTPSCTHVSARAAKPRKEGCDLNTHAPLTYLPTAP